MATKRLNQHTAAYAKWKKQTQDTFDFSVLVCSAVPTLKRNLKLYEKGIIETLTKPDHYGPAGELTKEHNDRSLPQLRQKADGYKEKLSRYILISNFSFFESYVKDVVDEMVAFHGGPEQFAQSAMTRASTINSTRTSELDEACRKLRGQTNPKNKQRSANATKELKEMGYVFPTDLFSSYGISAFLRSFGNMFAKDIPSILKDGLHMPFRDDEVLEFHNIRDARNTIAHGNSITVDLTKVTEMCKFLRTIALRLDQHILRNYMISEKYR